MVSGQRRMQGANTMAKALADIRLVFSCRAILKKKKKTQVKQRENNREVGRGDEKEDVCHQIHSTEGHS